MNKQLWWKDIIQKVATALEMEGKCHKNKSSVDIIENQ